MIGRLVSRLRTDERGAAIIELAIIAPVLAVLTIGVVDISNAFNRKLVLEQAAQRAIERVMQTTGTTTVEDTIKDEAICQVNGVNDDGSCKASPITAANVTVSYRLECTDAAGAITSQSSTDATAFDDFYCDTGTVSEAKYIQVAVTDTYAPMFPIHFGALNDDGTYHLTATAGMRTK